MMNFCSTCGAILKNTDKYCSSCGIELISEKASIGVKLDQLEEYTRSNPSVVGKRFVDIMANKQENSGDFGAQLSDTMYNFLTKKIYIQNREIEAAHKELEQGISDTLVAVQMEWVQMGYALWLAYMLEEHGFLKPLKFEIGVTELANGIIASIGKYHPPVGLGMVMASLLPKSIKKYLNTLNDFKTLPSGTKSKFTNNIYSQILFGFMAGELENQICRQDD